jgi:hypothetical protein
VLARTTGRIRRALPWDDAQISPHEILGVEAKAAPETIRRAYLELVQIWHPDRFPNDPALQQAAEVATKRINEAYESLCRPKRPRARTTPWARGNRPSASSEHYYRDYIGATYSTSSWDGSAPAWTWAVCILILLIWLVTSLLLFYAIILWI